MSKLRTVHDIVRDAENEYINGKAVISKYVTHSMAETIDTIDAYINSTHISGEKDSLGREKPFFNIVVAARNIWYRATDIDRKNIRFIPQNTASTTLAFVANVILQKWMDENRFGKFLNDWGRTLATYGSSVPKFVEKEGKLIPSIVPWNRFIADQVDFEAIPRIEKFYKTPEQLRRMTQYDRDQVDALIDAYTTRKNLDGTQKDDQDRFIEIYEVHGELDSRLLEEDPDLNIDDKDIVYRQQMHVISFFSGKDGKEGEFTLYKGKEAKDPYMITHLIEEDGRTLGMGAVEYLFQAQWMANHTVKNMKDTLDLASKLIFQTADTRYVNRNVLTSIQTGEIFIHDENKPMTQVNNSKPDIVALQNFGVMWQNLGKEQTSTPDALRGNTMPSGTPYSLGAYLGGEAGSLFEIMTENKGFAIEDMMRKHIIPHIKKTLKNTDEVVAILDDAGIQELDALYIPKKAIENYNERSTEEVLNGEIPAPFNMEQEQQAVKEEMAPLGNVRGLVPDKIGKKTWDEIFSDFQWSNLKVEVTNENVDKQAVFQTLSTVFRDIVTNPGALNDPNARMVFNNILRETGKLSPVQLTTAGAQPSPAPANEVPKELPVK